MEKRDNYKNKGLWIIRDFDGLYLCTRKPYKNYYSEHEDAFTWSCEGNFMRIDDSYYFNSVGKHFKDLKFEDDPVKVEIVPESFFKRETATE